MKKRLFFLVGPTAVGKTEVSIVLAKKLNAEIISCDSMQVYKGMNIITSKPSSALRKRVKHHLIDIVSPCEEYNVSMYRKLALRKTKDIIARGKYPLLVGGTGLYMSILIDGIFENKFNNTEIRQQLYKEADLYGSGYLHDKLKEVDPEAAKKIHYNDKKRIIRALEVFKVTGQPISKLQKQRKGLKDDFEIRIFCLDMQRDKLYQRIEERVDGMFSKGLVKEVKKILRLKLSKTASCAIGIKELKGYFDGEYDLDKARELIKRNTRWYAKRQLTWFRKDKRIEWIEITEKEKPRQIAERIWNALYWLR